MLPLPSAAAPLVLSLGIAFSEPTFNRVAPLLIGAILLRGRRSVTAILWTMRQWVPGHMTSYHRVLSRASWLLCRAIAPIVIVPQGRAPGSLRPRRR